MTRDVRASGERPLFWMRSSLKDIEKFPVEVQEHVGYALSAAQYGGKHPEAKPWRGGGAGVFEVVEDFRGDTFRAVYTVRFRGAVYVLHAFQKKSKTGIKTPASEREMIRRRLKTAEEHYAARQDRGETEGRAGRG